MQETWCPVAIPSYGARAQSWNLSWQTCGEKVQIRLEVLTAVTMKMAVFWVVAPCTLIWVYRRFEDLYCLHHRGDWGNTDLWKVGRLIPIYMAPQPRRQHLQKRYSDVVCAASRVSRMRVRRRFYSAPQAGFSTPLMYCTWQSLVRLSETIQWTLLDATCDINRVSRNDCGCVLETMSSLYRSTLLLIQSATSVPRVE
jgi:hypothetical protein